VTASGGDGGPYTWTATGLPPGLTISSGGAISGTPTETGGFKATVTATDAHGDKKSQAVTITITQLT
jgi:hypothetical protein